jgi:2-methylcitrate dehydratase PrpD
VDLAADLIKEHNINSSDIVKVIQRTPDKEFPGNTRTEGFEAVGHATMSSYFNTAAALLGRPVGSYKWYAEHYNDSEVIEFIKKIEFIREKGRDKVTLELFTRDGRHLVTEGLYDHMFGTTIERSIAKFNNLAADIIGHERAERIIDTVLNFDRVQDMRQLTDLLVSG